MALTLSSAITQEKNKISSTGAWLVLLQIDFDSTTIRLAYNTEDVTWNGYTWQKFPFDIDDVKESAKGELPSLKIRVCNVNNLLTQYIDESDGGIGAEVTIRVVHSDYLSETDPVLEEVFEVTGSHLTPEWVIFDLSAENPLMRRFPPNRYMKNVCRYKEFKGTQCGYTGSETTCNRTFSQCQDYGNEARFGGFPSVGYGGVYAD